MRWTLSLTALAMALLLFAGCAHQVAAPQPPAPAPATAASATAPDPAVVQMPDAPGKADVVRVCGGCHTLARVVRQRQTREQWQATLKDMQGNGMFASAAELHAILDYLSRNYGPKQP